MVWILPLLSQHRVTWPSWRIISLLFMFTLLLVRRIFALGSSYFRRLLGVVLQVDAESICALTTFDFLPCMRCRLAKYFLAKWAVSHSVTKPSLPMSSETKVDCCCRDCRRVPLLQTRVKWQVMPHFPHIFPIAGQCCWQGCWCFPPHQKHCEDSSDLLVKWTCSCWVFLAVFISLFAADAVTSNVLAASTTSRNLTFSCVVLCLCPFPINFTRRASDVSRAINWSLMSSSAKSWYSHCAPWFRILVSHDTITSFSCYGRRRNFCRSPDTQTLAPKYSLSALITLWGFFRSA